MRMHHIWTPPLNKAKQCAKRRNIPGSRPTACPQIECAAAMLLDKPNQFGEGRTTPHAGIGKICVNSVGAEVAGERFKVAKNPVDPRFANEHDSKAPRIVSLLCQSSLTLQLDTHLLSPIGVGASRRRPVTIDLYVHPATKDPANTNHGHFAQDYERMRRHGDDAFAQLATRPSHFENASPSIHAGRIPTPRTRQIRLQVRRSPLLRWRRVRRFHTKATEKQVRALALVLPQPRMPPASRGRWPAESALLAPFQVRPDPRRPPARQRIHTLSANKSAPFLRDQTSEKYKRRALINRRWPRSTAGDRISHNGHRNSCPAGNASLGQH